VRGLAGDIGGTNARLAIVDVGAAGVRVICKRRLSSRDFPGLAPMVRAFLAEAGGGRAPGAPHERSDGQTHVTSSGS
jgi:glucokinase